MKFILDLTLGLICLVLGAIGLSQGQYGEALQFFCIAMVMFKTLRQ